MDNNQFLLHRADITDVDRLSKFSQKYLRETFVEDVNDQDSYLYSLTNSEDLTRKINNTKRAVWLIEDTINDELVAFAIAGPCEIDDIRHSEACLDKYGLINFLYIRDDQQSREFGQQLMNVILPWLEEYYPSRPIWLTVHSKNTNAEEFYTHYGFKKVENFDHHFIMKRQTTFISKDPHPQES